MSKKLGGTPQSVKRIMRRKSVHSQVKRQKPTRRKPEMVYLSVMRILKGIKYKQRRILKACL